MAVVFIGITLCFWLLAAPFLPALLFALHHTGITHKTSISSPRILNPAAVAAQATRQGDWLVIPQIGVDTPIVQGHDVDILDREEGVWNQAGTPGVGNFVLAGHRFKYVPPNTATLYNLNKLSEGDEIIVWWKGKKHSYQVQKTFSVKRDAVDILNPTENEQLTLYTCEDIDTTKRLVVIALPSPNISQ
jgi:LPXTG-site transpeptidase (sortase) family protein